MGLGELPRSVAQEHRVEAERESSELLTRATGVLSVATVVLALSTVALGWPCCPLEAYLRHPRGEPGGDGTFLRRASAFLPRRPYSGRRRQPARAGPPERKPSVSYPFSGPGASPTLLH